MKMQPFFFSEQFWIVMFNANDKDRKFSERQEDSIKKTKLTASHLLNISKHKTGCKIMTKLNFS